jgi:hypothetical protein
MNIDTKHNSVWLYRAMTFFAVPIFLLALILTSRQDDLQTAAIIWLTLCGCYVILISTLGIANQPSGSKTGIPLVQTLVRLLGSVVWGGFFRVIYFFAYWLIFSRENLSPQ